MNNYYWYLKTLNKYNIKEKYYSYKNYKKIYFKIYKYLEINLNFFFKNNILKYVIKNCVFKFLILNKNINLEENINFKEIINMLYSVIYKKETYKLFIKYIINFNFNIFDFNIFENNIWYKLILSNFKKLRELIINFKDSYNNNILMSHSNYKFFKIIFLNFFF